MSKHYIDKKEMYEEVIKTREQGRVTEKLGQMFMTLAENYSHDRKFREYERRYGRAFKEDLIATGLHACIKAAPKFNPEESDNPFGYFTTCLFRAYIGYLKKEYGYMNTKNALKVDQGLRGDYGYEEMIKEQEEAQKVEDEEAIAEEAIAARDEDDDEDEEGRDTDEFGMEDGSESDTTPQKKSSRVVYDHLEHMTLWGDEEEENKSEISFNDYIGKTFGVK